MTLAELGATCTSGSRGWASRYVKHGDLFVRITNLRRSSIYPDLSDSRYVAVDPNEPEARRTRLAVGDLLISITADIGIIGYVDKTIPNPAYINQHIARVRLDPKRVDSRFVAYYLASWGPQRGFVGSTDTGAKAGMNLATVSRLATLVPPLPEQRVIAAALGDTDSLIATLERLHAKKRAIKQGMMQQLLTGKTRLPGFDGAWAEATLGSVATVTMGQSPAGATYNSDGRGLPLIQGNADICNRMTVDRIWTTAPTKTCAAGDVLLTVRAPVGYTAVASQASCLGRGVCGVSSQGDNRFLFHALVYAEPAWAVYEQGSTFTSVGSRETHSFTLRWPSDAEERTAIGRVLDDIDNEIEVLDARLAKAKAIKQGMMQELLSGRTGLPVEVKS